MNKTKIDEHKTGDQRPTCQHGWTSHWQFQC